jgi:glycosyltransferase involved in cell wall biosynthesis
VKLKYFLTLGNSLSDWHQNGTLKRELKLLNALSASYSEIECISYGGFLDKLFTKDYEKIEFKFRRYFENYDIYIQSILQNLVRSEEIDVIRTNQFYGADKIMRNLKILKMKKIRFVLRMGYLPSDNIFFEQSLNQFEKIMNIEKICSEQADVVVVTSERIKSKLLERKIQKDKIEVIPNYVDCKLFVPAEVNNTNFTVGYIGRLAKEKNLVRLLYSLKGVDCDVIFIGKGPMKAELMKIANEESINLRIYSRVPNENLSTYISRFDIFILNSEYEGNPKSLIEAMACGKIVIGNNAQGINDIIDHLENGIIVNNSSELRDYVIQIKKNRVTFNNLGINAREYIVKNYSFERIMKLELNLVNKLENLY